VRKIENLTPEKRIKYASVANKVKSARNIKQCPTIEIILKNPKYFQLHAGWKRIFQINKKKNGSMLLYSRLLPITIYFEKSIRLIGKKITYFIITHS
jgi:hypothetical protein